MGGLSACGKVELPGMLKRRKKEEKEDFNHD